MLVQLTFYKYKKYKKVIDKSDKSRYNIDK